MTYQTLQVEKDRRDVLYLTLNRPQKKNALNAQMIAEITEFCRDVRQDQDIRAIVLSGANHMFCAGGDLRWMQAQMKADRETRMREATKLAEMLFQLNTLFVPIIGKIENIAFGGGIGMACVCDCAIATDDTKFGFTETKLGLIPATIAPYIMAKMGEAKAREVFMSAKIFGAEEAKNLHIVTRNVDKSALDQAVEAEIVPYLSVAPQAVRKAKKLVRSLGTPITTQQIEESVKALANVWEGTEALEGINAFFEKREPRWIKH